MEKNNSKSSKYIKIMGAALVFLVAALIATAVYFYGGKKDGEATGEETKETSNSANIANTRSENAETGKLSGDSDYLVICTDENRKDIIFLCIFDFRIYSGNTIVIPLSTDTASPNGTYASAFAYGGTDLLIKNIKSVRSCEIDRYVMIDKKGFYEMFDSIGKIKLNVSEPFTYEASDKSNYVEAGVNELDSAMLYSYLTLCSLKPNGSEIITDIVCSVANGYVAGISSDRLDAVFSELVNCVTTDFSIHDYSDCKKDIEYLIDSKIQFSPYSLH